MGERKFLKYLPTILIIFVIICALILAVFFKKLFFKEKVEQKKVIQEITVITPPPPPPPPPEQPPEPEIEEVIEEELDEPTPDDTPDESISEDLGLDAEGEAGGDNFGLVGKKGGSGLLGGGGYADYVKKEVNKALQKDRQLSRMGYKAKVTVWVDDNGDFLRYEVVMLDGSKAVKTALEGLLNRMGGLERARPLEEDKWFTFRITSVI